MTPEKPDITLFFPVYNDAATVRTVTEKGLAFLREYARNYELLIIDDGSPDDSGKIADELAAAHPGEVRAIHHEHNRGYGAALKTGFANARYEYICFTDGDDEYDIREFEKLMKHAGYYDLIITFRYKRMYSSFRIVVSRVYNWCLRRWFDIPYRDISTGLRVVRKTAIENVTLDSDGPFIGAELTIKLTLKGYRVGEVGIQTFPRQFNRGSVVTLRNILATIRDMRDTHRRIFSGNYELETIDRKR